MSNIGKVNRLIRVYFKKILKKHACHFKIFIKNWAVREEFLIFFIKNSVTKLFKSIFKPFRE